MNPSSPLSPGRDSRLEQEFVELKPRYTKSAKNLVSDSLSGFWSKMISPDLCKSALVTPQSLNGRWRKSADMSDNTKTLYEYANLPWYLRKGERFFNYLEIESDESKFRRTINAGGFLNVSEVYPWNGSPARLRRRDLRSGTMQGKVESIPQGAKTMVSWSDPHGLSMEDSFCLSSDGQILTIYTTARRPDRSDELTIKQVFTKI